MFSLGQFGYYLNTALCLHTNGSGQSLQFSEVVIVPNSGAGHCVIVCLPCQPNTHGSMRVSGTGLLGWEALKV